MSDEDLLAAGMRPLRLRRGCGGWASAAAGSDDENLFGSDDEGGAVGGWSEDGGGEVGGNLGHGPGFWT